MYRATTRGYAKKLGDLIATFPLTALSPVSCLFQERAGSDVDHLTASNIIGSCTRFSFPRETLAT